MDRGDEWCLGASVQTDQRRMEAREFECKKESQLGKEQNENKTSVEI